METLRVDSEMMESLLLECLIAKAPCKTEYSKIRDYNGKTLLHWTVAFGLKDESKFLLEQQIDPNARDDEGRTPLHYASNVEVAELLLKHGADPNAQDNEGNTPLHVAVREGDLDMVELLIKYANPNIKNNKGLLPIHYAKNCQIMTKLLQITKDLNIRDATLLHNAAKNGCKEVAKFLLDNGADPNVRDDEGRTPLHYASNVEVAELLLKHGADPNAQDNEGNTPLHVALYDERIEVARLLISVANVYIPNRNGVTPIVLIAMRCRHDKTCTELLEMIPSFDTVTVVRTAFNTEQLKLLRLLLRRGLLQI